MAGVIALQSMFEGLFVRALRPTGAFKERLREKGYDLDRRQTSYPLAVFEDCLDVAAAELFPELDRAQAWERLGRLFIGGYFQTLVGRMISATLPFMSPRLFVGRVPRFMTTGLQGAEVRLEWTDARHATLTLLGVHELSSALMAGVLAECFARMKVSPVQLERRGLTGVDTELLITLP